jgi:hypothetical protein
VRAAGAVRRGVDPVAWRTAFERLFQVRSAPSAVIFRVTAWSPAPDAGRPVYALLCLISLLSLRRQPTAMSGCSERRRDLGSRWRRSPSSLHRLTSAGRPPAVMAAAWGSDLACRRGPPARPTLPRCVRAGTASPHPHRHRPQRRVGDQRDSRLRSWPVTLDP